MPKQDRAPMSLAAKVVAALVCLVLLAVTGLFLMIAAYCHTGRKFNAIHGSNMSRSQTKRELSLYRERRVASGRAGNLYVDSSGRLSWYKGTGVAGSKVYRYDLLGLPPQIAEQTGASLFVAYDKSGKVIAVDDND